MFQRKFSQGNNMKYSARKTMTKGIEAAAGPTIPYIILKIINTKLNWPLTESEILFVAVSLSSSYYMVKNYIRNKLNVK